MRRRGMITRIILGILIIGFTIGFIESTEGLVEFKKYKVINSPKVCGDKLCSEIDEKIAKKGYFNKVTSITNPKIIKPKSAPARVDCTRWDTPIAVQANNIPGPAVFEKRDNFVLILQKIDGNQAYNLKFVKWEDEAWLQE